MRFSNFVMIAIALVCALAAALLARVWLNSQTAQTPKAEAAKPAPSRSIVVAARDFKYGDQLSAKTVKLVPWGAESLPKGAFVSPKALFGASKTQTALHAIAEGEPVLQNKLVGGGSSNALSARIGSDMKAATIRVSEASGVSGLVQPDDRVDVFLTYTKQTASEDATASSIVVLLQNVRVLALDQDTQRKDQPTAAKTVTLEVTTEDAQRLHLGARIGELSLVLNSVGVTGIAKGKTRTISTDDLMEAQKLVSAPLTTAATPGPSGPTVTITRSTDRQNYQVQDDPGRDEIGRHEFLRQDLGSAPPGQRLFFNE